ncbi:MAG: hypothetical protein HFF57_01355 [Lawsonibacter sp.]|jgi:hypothetical protein|nr:hypothetical protein [Lawsonibacter sp.]
METLDTLYPAFCLADCQRIDLMAANSPYPVPMHKVTLQSGQQGFREVMELLEGRSYRRSALRRISDRLLKGHTWREGDFRWDINLHWKDGRSLLLRNFFGRLYWHGGGVWHPVSTNDQKAFLRQTLDLILRLEGESRAD